MRRIFASLLFTVFFLSVVRSVPAAENATRTTDTGKARLATQGDEGDNQETAQRRKEQEEAERAKMQQEARRKRAHKEKQKFGKSTAKSLMKESESEECDWTKNPIPFLKGELCGAHYKVLGLDRKGKLPEKSEIKKAYRQRSLEVHPDKNPSPEAAAAFKIVQDAYECLSDERCKDDYEYKLEREEQRLAGNNKQQP